MEKELQKEAEIRVDGDHKLSIEIPNGVKAGVIKVKRKVSVEDLFKFLSEEASVPKPVAGIGENDETMCQ